MTAPRKSIQVSTHTLERLRTLKGPRATFDDVLNDLMDSLPEEVVPQRELRLIRRRVATVRPGKDWRQVRRELGDE